MSNDLILIIEDEPETRDLMHRYLRREGFRTVDAPNAKIGLEHYRKLKPDLVLLDITLPDQNGYEVLAGNQASRQYAGDSCDGKA
ncbi:response regulator transcription factor [Rhizobium beringeri]